jgi:mannosyl-oligosaccharide alpha-1,2-mannosidase
VRILGFLQNTGYYILVFEMIFLFVLSLVLSLFCFFKVSRNPSWASEGSSILSELGTLSLEFNYLSDVTGKDVFRQKIQKLTGTIKRLDRHADGGLYPNFINPWTGDWGDRHVSMGAFGDSFYEYLLKSWLLSGRQDDEARLMYIDAVEAAMSKLIQVSREGFTYFADSNSGRLEHKMQHLACFSGAYSLIISVLK